LPRLELKSNPFLCPGMPRGPVDPDAATANPTPCPLCGETRFDPSGVTRHLRIVHGQEWPEGLLPDDYLPPAPADVLTDEEQDATEQLDKHIKRFTALMGPDPVSYIYPTIPEPRGAPKVPKAQVEAMYAKNPDSFIEGHARRLAMDYIGREKAGVIERVSNRRARRASADHSHRALHLIRVFNRPHGATQRDQPDYTSEGHHALHRELGLSDGPTDGRHPATGWTLYRSHVHLSNGEIVWNPYPSPPKPTPAQTPDIEAIIEAKVKAILEARDAA
jgi:hypothetical protein